MIYTLNRGVDDKQERIESYILRALPILVASAIAIFGAFNQAERSQNDSNNQEPLAIYTAPSSDLGGGGNPQGNGGNTQSTAGSGSGSPQAPSDEQRASSTAGTGTAPTRTSSGSTTSVLPVGGMGGGDTTSSTGDSGDCLCEQLQDTVDTQSSDLTQTIEPVTEPVTETLP